MYVIMGNGNRLKRIKKFLESKGHVVRETQFPSYIITSRDPSNDIPETLKPYLKVDYVEGSVVKYRKILKGMEVLESILDPTKGIKEGDSVIITGGTYKGFVGIVKEKNSKNCMVEISVWGKPVKDCIPFKELEKER